MSKTLMTVKAHEGWRRARRVVLGVRDIIAFVYLQTALPEFVTVATAGLPDGCSVLGIWLDEMPMRVEVAIHHPDFPEVPDGQLPPLFGDGVMSYYSYAIKDTSGLPADANSLLHRLWGKAKDGPDYDKRQWVALEAILIAKAGTATPPVPIPPEYDFREYE